MHAWGRPEDDDDDPTTTDVSVRRGVTSVRLSVCLRLFVHSFIRLRSSHSKRTPVYPYGDASRRVLGVGSVLGEVYPHGARGGEEDGGGGEGTRRRRRTRRRVKKYEVGAENGSRDGERRCRR